MKNLSFLGLIVLTIACKKSGSDAAISIKNTWILSSIQDNKSKDIITYPDSILNKESIVFTDSMSTFIFNGACNQGFGKYSISGQTISIDSMALTKRSCQYIKWERILYNNLDSAFEYEINNSKLTIQSKGIYNLTFSLDQN